MIEIDAKDALSLKKIEGGKKLKGKEIVSLLNKGLIGENAITEKGKTILKHLNQKK